MQKSNPNVLSVDYAKIISSKSAIVHGAPSLCLMCNAAFSNLSKVDIKENGWYCRFCGSFSKCGMGKLPSKIDEEGVCYTEKEKVPLKREEDIRILFLIDNSGSMGRMDLKELSEKSPISVLNRIIHTALEGLKKNYSKSKVGLIFFNNKIRLVGDACGEEVKIDKIADLRSKDKIREIVRANQKLLSVPIEKSFLKLLAAVNENDIDNATALGPAVLAGLELLKGCNPDSKMLIFTDGKANIGVGELDELDPGREVDKKFYELAAKEAREMGVEVSLYRMAIKDCHADVYDPMVESTNGDLLLVNPSEIEKMFKMPEKKKELAFDCDISIRVPKIFKFRFVFEGVTKDTPFVLQRKFGRIIEGSKEVIQIMLNPKAKKEDIETFKEIPIQVIIQMTSGSLERCTYVYTKKFDVTQKKEKKFDAEVMEDNVNNLALLGARNDKLDVVKVELGHLINTELEEEKDTVSPLGPLQIHAKNIMEAIESKKKFRTEDFPPKSTAKKEDNEDVLKIVNDKKFKTKPFP